MIAECERWYLLRLKHGKHNDALHNLYAQNYEIFSPNISLVKMRNGIKEDVIEPLFPGYVFIRLNNASNWSGVIYTRGVKEFVRFGEYPTPVKDEVIEYIIDQVEESESMLNEKYELTAGDKVVISGEGFKGMQGVFKCESGSQRSMVLVSYLGKETEVQVKNTLLKKAL